MYVPPFLVVKPRLKAFTAKKEDNPEQALKEFRAIVDQEEEKGDWYASGILIARHHLIDDN